jgi:hypothetical protein
VKALAQHACGHSALVAAGGEAALTAAAASRQGAVAAALAKALEMLRRPPEHAAGPAAPRLCAACGERASRARPLQQCGGCHGPERWCGAECQRSSWAGHKAVCLERRAGAAAAAAAPAGSERAA